MFRDIGLPEWLFEIDQSPATDWTRQLLNVHRDYPAAKAKVQQAMQFVAQRQADTMRTVRRAIGLPIG